MAARFDRVPEGGWQNENVNEKAVAKGRGRMKGTVMFPTCHDLTTENAGNTLAVLGNLLAAGNNVLVVSKPRVVPIVRLLGDFARFKKNLLLRFTIGSGDSDTLSFWEPSASLFAERLICLARAHGAGFQTSVSMEPLLETDEDKVVALVSELAPYVTESIWIGKLNKGEARLRANGHAIPENLEALAHLEASQSDERIRSLVARLHGHPLIRWKESIKQVVGADLAEGADEGWAGKDGSGVETREAL
jgi:DNA repair photolyase